MGQSGLYCAFHTKGNAMRKAIVIVLVAAMLLSFLPPSFQQASAHVAGPVDPLREILRGEPASPEQRADADAAGPEDPLRKILRGSSRAAEPKANAEAAASTSECRLDEFSSAEEEALLELIDSVPFLCIHDYFFDDHPFSHFDDIPDSRIDVFSEKNMIYIAVSARERADEYDSTQGRLGLIGKLYVFLHAGYWNYANYPSYFNHINKYQIQSEAESALRAFIGNEYFDDEEYAHNIMLTTIIDLASLLDLGPVFFFDFAELLRKKSRTRAYIQSEVEWELVLAILVFLEENQQRIVSAYGDDDSSAFESSLIGLAETLVDIGMSNRLNRSVPDFSRLAYVLRSILYDFSEERPALLSAMKTNLRRLVNYWEEKDSSRYYISIGIAVYLYRRNHTHLTDLVEEFLAKILPYKYSCGKHVVRSQEASQEHREEVCRKLAYQEELFHSVLDTKKRPAPHARDFHGESIEIIIFIRGDDYFSSGAVFGIDPSYSSGTYATASSKHDIARAFVRAPDYEPFSYSFFYTLRHEFVHYLDSRYNGGGGGYFWFEGIAVYLALENNNPDAISITRAEGVSLRSILDSSHGGPVNYDFNYSATRFLFERHPEDVAELLDIFYKGNPDPSEYLNYVRNSIGDSYDDEFASWLETATANDDPLPRITRKPRPGDPEEPGGGGEEEPGAGAEEPEVFPSRLILSADDERKVFDLLEFNISDGLVDPVFSVVSSDPSIAEAALNGSVLVITVKKPGSVQITVRVGNRGEALTAYKLQITIDNSECPRHICRNLYSGWRLYLLQQLESRAETLIPR